MAWIRRLGVSAIVLAPMFAAAQQPTGIVTGRVVDRGTQQPVVGATVRVVGTTRGGQTSDSGTYRITGVPAGAANVQALRIGYASITRPLTISAGQTATVDFTLDPLVRAGLVETRDSENEPLPRILITKQGE